MRKLLIWLMTIIMTMSLLTGCGSSDPSASDDRDDRTQQTKPDRTNNGDELPQDDAIGHVDTYWVASEWYGDDGEGMEGTQSLPTDMWFLDLIVRADGTARFRDIREGILLMDDSCLNLAWERTEVGEFLFYSVLYAEPILRGVCENGILSLQYWGVTLTMQQERLPQTVGQRYAPAELTGTWVLVSGETEGYQWDAMPNELCSIVFKVVSYEEVLTMTGDIEERDYYGNMMDSVYAQTVEVLQEPLYEGCENETWSVRIGAASAKDANGYPIDTEYFATLLSEDELLMQRYYTLDGAPAVSYQTYLRLPDLVSWMDSEFMRLEYSNWVCTGYEDLSGEELPFPAELEDLSIILSENQVCHMDYGDGNSCKGTWMLGKGGVLLMRGEETEEDPFWFGGVISGYWVETTSEYLESYQMALYYNGGILKLAMTSYG